MAPKFPKFGELNSAERSQNPESLEPENLDGLDLIALNNSKATSPNILKKIIGPLKGVVIKGQGDQTSIQTGISFLPFISGKTLAKHRIRVPEIHAHLPEPEDYNEVPPTIACLYPEFIAQSTDIPNVEPGTYVWCDFLDRNNMEEPVYLGPVDPQAASTSTPGAASNSATLKGSPASGNPISGPSTPGQQIASINAADYKISVNLKPGSINKDVVDAALSYPDGAGGLYSLGGSGVIETIYHKGSVLLSYTGSTYCNGTSFTIAMKVLNKRNLLQNKEFDQVKTFQLIWYGSRGDTERQQGPALDYLGLGGNVSQQEALPGDFAQLWRTNNSGHSVVFLGWAEENGKIVGIKYRSSQGKGPGSGVGNRTEYFSDTGKGAVIRERVYISRIKA